jgi:hypothetical protein
MHPDTVKKIPMRQIGIRRGKNITPRLVHLLLSATIIAFEIGNYLFCIGFKSLIGVRAKTLEKNKMPYVFVNEFLYLFYAILL